MIYRRLINIMIAGFCLLALPACHDYDDCIVAEELGPQESYVNFTFTVSTGKDPVTRATPAGGENGDGREAGFERENEVTGVTLVFYQHHNNGINATASSTPTLDDTEIELVKYYPVWEESRDSQGTTYDISTGNKEDGDFDEAIYTTGNQKIDESDGLDLRGQYRVLVIANVDLTTGANKISKGDKLADVRDIVYSSAIYTGTGTDVGLRDNASNFVMTSENDVELNFAAGGVKTVEKEGALTKEFYSFSGIRVERMAARIDFSTQYSYKVSSVDKYGAEYKTTDKNGNAYPYPGYVYPVYKSTDTYGNPTSSDRFVLTAIIPFNLSLTNTGCGEYLFKRTDDATAPYLADETTTSWVIDPDRSSKSAADHPTYFDYNLSAIVTKKDDLTSLTNRFTTASFQGTSALYPLKVSGTNTVDNMIIAYPKENTLLPESPLYYYATGIAIEGYYFVNDDATSTPTRFLYVGYLRHQGEADSYTIDEIDSLDPTADSQSGPAMNYGIVRNNIYRVAIHKINEKSIIELSIKVKKWDPYIHDYIYM